MQLHLANKFYDTINFNVLFTDGRASNKIHYACLSLVVDWTHETYSKLLLHTQ